MRPVWEHRATGALVVMEGVDVSDAGYESVGYVVMAEVPGHSEPRPLSGAWPLDRWLRDWRLTGDFREGT